MKSIILSIVTLITLNLKAQESPSTKIEAILNNNMGKVFGVVKENSDIECDFEVSDKVLPDALAVFAGMGPHLNLMLFPDDIWNLNEVTHTITYAADAVKKDFMQISFNPTSSKVTGFTYYHNSGSIVGDTCLLH